MGSHGGIRLAGCNGIRVAFRIHTGRWQYRGHGLPAEYFAPRLERSFRYIESRDARMRLLKPIRQAQIIVFSVI